LLNFGGLMAAPQGLMVWLLPLRHRF
jgi:hypothetical protein